MRWVQPHEESNRAQAPLTTQAHPANQPINDYPNASIPYARLA